MVEWAIISNGILAVAITFALFILYNMTPGKTPKDKFNLWFRKPRTIKVNLITRSGRNIEHFVVPDENGIFAIKDAAYLFDRDSSIHNARWRVPECTVYESQTHSPSTPVKEVLVPAIVEIEGDDGTIVQEEKLVPRHVLSFRAVDPKTTEGMTAQQINRVVNAKIVRDIISASSTSLQKIDKMYLLLLVILGIIIVGGFMIGSAISDLKTGQEVLYGISQRTG